MPIANFFRKLKVNKVYLLLILAFMLIVWTFLIYYSGQWNMNHQIEKISVEGNTYLSEDEVLKAIDSKATIGMLKSKIALSDIENKARKSPFIRKAIARFSGKSKIIVLVEERKPLSLFITRNGELAYLDKDGTIFPHRAIRAYNDLPIVTGLYQNNEVDKKALKDAMSILDKLYNLEDKFVYNLISELKYNSHYNSFEIITSDTGIKVLFGRLDKIEEKATKLSRFWQRFMISTPADSLKYIDIRWQKQVLVMPA